MKTQRTTKLEFTKQSLVELNEQKMASIIGGTVTIVGGTSLVMMTMLTMVNKVE
ncbi:MULTISPECIES: hypothetical protein [Flavobacterium]|uniref:hypothetical protein n=1 Tax=Flavobacterium TaxID=237 RepID=UPI0015B047C7|nr:MULTISPECIES: hypothetical protein [Flavobacterium]MBN9283336.1 hypothetical protein [Flavobacterium sp.]